MPRARAAAAVLTAVLAAAVLAAGCGDDSSADPDGGGDDLCTGRPCLTHIEDEADWASVSVEVGPGSRCDFVTESKYLAPASEDAELPSPVFMDVGEIRFHLEFMQTELSAYFGGLTADVYARIVQRRATRLYWAGSIFEVTAEDGATLGWGFDVIVDPTSAAERLSSGEIAAIHDQLAARFDLTFGYAPTTAEAIADARDFDELGFPVYLPRVCTGGGCDDPGAHCVDIPAAVSMCGHFRDNRTIAEEHAVKIRLDAVPLSVAVPLDGPPVAVTLFGGGAFGPDRTAIDAADDGLIERLVVNGYVYWVYTQTMSAGPDVIALRWEIPFGEAPTQAPLVEPWISEQFYAYGVVNEGTEYEDTVALGSCTAENLELFTTTATLAGGDQIVLDARYGPPLAGSGPLLPVAASVTLGGVTRTVNDYFQLTYAGQHHNWDNNYWILFDTPIVDGADEIWGVWIDEADFTCCPVEISTLDADRAAIKPLDVVDYTGLVNR